MTTPVEELTEAITGDELFQIPPLVVLDHVAVDPTQRRSMPVIVWATGALTVTVLVPVLTHAPDVTL